MTINVLSATFAVVAESPAWAANLADNTWEQMTVANGYTDTLDMVTAASGDPGAAGGTTPSGGYNVSNSLDQWSSAAMDTSRQTLWILATGGDGGHPGNNVYALELNREQPRMREANASSAYRAGSVTYSDGTCPACHQYNMVEYFPPLDQVFFVGVGPVCAPGAFGFDSVYSYLCATEQWNFGGGSSVAGVWSSLGLSATEITGSAACYDSNNLVLWHHSNSGGNQLRRFDPPTVNDYFANTASTHGFLVCNPDSGYLLQGGGGIGSTASNTLYDTEVANPGLSPTTLTNIADGSDGNFSDTNLWKSGQASFQDHIGHVVVNDTHYFLDNGGNIWTAPAINKANPNGSAWTVTRLGESGTRPVLPSGSFGGGAYGRFRHVPLPNISSGLIFVCVGRSGERPSVIKVV